VPKKEGPIKAHAQLSEFLHRDHKKVVLLDNNILAAPNLGRTVKDIDSAGVKVNFCQGLDIRLVDEKAAQMLAGLKSYNIHFTNRAYYFAFDHPSIEPEVRSGVEMLLRAGIRKDQIYFYLLVGFDTTFEQDMRRYQILWDELGVYPFVMLYNRSKDKRLHAFGRWINRRFHRNIPWNEYNRNPDRGN
jgi:hypothetical protein